MRTDPRLLLLLPLLALLSCAERTQQSPGKGFEGKLVQKISVGGDLFSQKNGDRDTSDDLTGASARQKPLQPAMTVTMYSKGDRVAYDMEIMGFPIKMHTIIDRSTRTITLCTPDKMAYVSDLHSLDPMRSKIDDSIEKHHNILDSLQSHMPKPTGQKKTINGLLCEEYKTTIADNDVTFWLTQDPRLKFYDIMRDALLGKQHTGLGGMDEALSILAPILGEGHVPVLTELSKHGKVYLKSELVTFSEEKVDDDVINVPSDYKVVKEDAGSAIKSSEKSSRDK